MSTNSKLRKVGRLMVKDGKYTDKSGAERIKWHEIGVVFATPHHSNMCIRLHANGFGEGQFCNVFYDDDKKPNFVDMVDITAAAATDISLEEIPF